MVKECCFKFLKVVSPYVIKPEDFIEWINNNFPMLFGIAAGHKILYDNGFFKNYFGLFLKSTKFEIIKNGDKIGWKLK